MAAQAKRYVALPPEAAAQLDRLVSSGSFASDEEAVAAGLRALRQQDETLDRWLWDEVVPVYDRVMADPSECIPAETVFAELRAHHAEQTKGKA